MHDNTQPATGPDGLHARAHAQNQEQCQALELRGDEEELFAALNRTLVRAVARRSGAQWALCEEAAQFAWIQLLRYQPQRERALSWLIVVGSREALRLVRTAAREVLSDCPPDRHQGGEWAPLGERIADPVCLQERIAAREALAELARLPDRQRRALTLKVAGLSYHEIARELGWSYTQVNRHLTRARKQLAKAA